MESQSLVDDHPNIDVVIIGAGMSGLFAAKTCVDAGLVVAVLEAKSRPGGRVFAEVVELDNDQVSLVNYGGMWMGPTQNFLKQLTEEYQVNTFPTYNQGNHIQLIGGKRSTYTGDIPNLFLHKLLDAQTVIWKLDKLAKTINLEEPWKSKDARKWDIVSGEAYIQGICFTEDVFQLVKTSFLTVLFIEISQVSMLYLLWYIASAGNVGELISLEGAQATLFEGGTYTFIEKMIEKIGSDNVFLDNPVTKISQNESGVLVTTSKLEIQGRYCIFAAPPQMTKFIEFTPSLPPLYRSLASTLIIGGAIKAHLFYETPWWRELGYSGQVVDTEGPICYIADESPTEGIELDPPVLPSLVLFITQKGCNSLEREGITREEDRRHLFERVVSQAFESDEALKSIGYFEYDWRNDPYIHGCPVGLHGTGALTSYKTSLREPEGRIHFASTELATIWAGYIDGALRSGHRAAQEIISML
eukprot:TRINITY_DN2498_c0_g1_i1.p1 TRINITY_DN2498_c0_g1~~TRINITY_DN2498_c0_g1_i1.p1  ORF type:complete len:472 (-),score=111.52 TRINITY_DN2498_c0_g1_i1:98-1513(-)